MSIDKTKRLSDITNEVKEFHPLLKQLFNNMPEIIDVEYTHGPTEMGADFVISKQHETFNNIEYIGIIAKIGKVHQNFDDIERQIDECEILRTFMGGREKIRISEVWVVVTGNITKGAQEKIHEKFKTRKIYFIDSNRLTVLIDDHVPVFWTDISLEAGSYLADLRSKTEEIDKNYNLLQTHNGDFYIEQDIYQRNYEKYRKLSAPKKSSASKVNIFEEIEKYPLILLEGGMGAGKSKLLRQIIFHYTLPEIFNNTNVIPIATTFKETIDIFDSDFSKLIEKKVGPKLEQAFQDGTYLVLMDGIDEKNLPYEQQEEKLNILIDSLKEKSNIKVVMTSRPLRVIERDSAVAKNLRHLEIRPLPLDKTIEFITKICDKLNIGQRIIEDLKKSQLFHELPKSPIAAILLAELISENSQELPSNLTELYSKYTELILGRWDIQKGLQSQKEYQALDNILMNLSRFMIENEMIYISIGDAKTYFQDYLSTRNLSIEPETLYQKLISRSNLYVEDSGSNTITFKHRTFGEFFYAKALAKDRTLKLDEKVFEPYWLNSFFFYFGILKDCPNELEQIAKITPDTEIKRWLKTFFIHNYYLAAYATPYNIITTGVKNSAIEAAQLFQDIKSKKIESIFSDLSPMHLLWFIQLLIRQNLSYNFFMKAMEDAVIEIDGADCDEVLKPYAIFFLNVAYMSQGGKQTFDFLLENYAENLPMELLAAFKNESEHIKGRTTLMKKQDRKINRIFRGNKTMINKMNDLFDKPIKLL